MRNNIVATLLVFMAVLNLLFISTIIIQDNEIDIINAKECLTVYKPVYIDQWGNAYDFVKEK